MPNHPQHVTLGLDPRGLYLSDVGQAKSPRVEPEGDGRWGDWMSEDLLNPRKQAGQQPVWPPPLAWEPKEVGQPNFWPQALLQHALEIVFAGADTVGQ